MVALLSRFNLEGPRWVRVIPNDTSREVRGQRETLHRWHFHLGCSSKLHSDLVYRGTLQASIHFFKERKATSGSSPCSPRKACQMLWIGVVLGWMVTRFLMYKFRVRVLKLEGGRSGAKGKHISWAESCIILSMEGSRPVVSQSITIK